MPVCDLREAYIFDNDFHFYAYEKRLKKNPARVSFVSFLN